MNEDTTVSWISVAYGNCRSEFQYAELLILSLLVFCLSIKRGLDPRLTGPRTTSFTWLQRFNFAMMQDQSLKLLFLSVNEAFFFWKT
jgi:hypothetical protein